MVKLSGECMLLSSLSCHNNGLERRTLKPLVRYSSQVLNKPCHSSQTNQCYSSILFRRQQENPFLKKRRVEERGAVEWGWGQRERANTHEGERESERESERALSSSFYIFFPPPGLPYANWAQSGVPFYLQSSLQSSDLPLTFFCSIFAGFSLLCLLATAILDSFSLFYLPNKTMLESTFVLVTFV